MRWYTSCSVGEYMKDQLYKLMRVGEVNGYALQSMVIVMNCPALRGLFTS